MELLFWIFLLASTSCAVQGWDLPVSTESLELPSGTNNTIICKSKPRIQFSKCIFQIYIQPENHVYNASLGPLSEESAEFGPFSVRYFGRGLDRGECGIELTAPEQYPEQKVFLVRCEAFDSSRMSMHNYTHVAETPDDLEYEEEAGQMIFPSLIILIIIIVALGVAYYVIKQQA